MLDKNETEGQKREAMNDSIGALEDRIEEELKEEFDEGPTQANIDWLAPRCTNCVKRRKWYSRVLLGSSAVVGGLFNVGQCCHRCKLGETCIAEKRKPGSNSIYGKISASKIEPALEDQPSRIPLACLRTLIVYPWSSSRPRRISLEALTKSEWQSLHTKSPRPHHISYLLHYIRHITSNAYRLLDLFLSLGD
ncbi:hypothetical protein BDZ45DRAFT_752478 [Acephala macrosclerotiorum]|nr:hypothetical protein BDZ45DRAFT_752478 [Acephala macrosclerotiorum]